jgi:repressor of nif and glnA expression
VWLAVALGVVVLGKVRLLVSMREHGARIESVPLKRLVELSGYRKTRWFFEDGWLILEAF